MNREELGKRIVEVALLRTEPGKEFTLRSGRKSLIYFDKYLFEAQPDILSALGYFLAHRIKPLNVDLIVVPMLGAVALGAATSMASGIPFAIVRNDSKTHGTAKAIEGPSVKGKRVVIIEDIITSGGQGIQAGETTRNAGAEVLLLLGTIDREEGGKEAIEQANFPYDRLFTKTELGI